MGVYCCTSVVNVGLERLCLACVNFGENRSIDATVRVTTDGCTDTLREANLFYNLTMGKIIINNFNVPSTPMSQPYR